MEKYISEFDVKGYTVIPSVISDFECDKLSDDIWDTLTHITKGLIKKNDNRSYRHIYDLYPLHSMLIQHYGIGHAQFMWDLRQNPEIINIYKIFYKYFMPNIKVDELLVSFDGISHHMPPEITGRGWFRQNWFHSDQTFTNNTFQCIQGWVTAHDICELDATLSVIEGTHKKQIRDGFQTEFNITDKKNWYKLSDIELNYFDNFKKVNITCPKGSLVLWDSRLLHCGKEPTKGRSEQKVRQVCYISYQPKILASPAILKKRKKAFEELRMTSHWASKPTLFPVSPRTYGNKLLDTNKIGKPILNDIGRSLI